ncbi:MAG: hypothetical protein K0S71_3003 [Clostridia bacterium]|jgi:hypothetical protein|nr:hypothetical protein [Clostridia bacterium]
MILKNNHIGDKRHVWSKNKWYRQSGARIRII